MRITQMQKQFVNEVDDLVHPISILIAFDFEGDRNKAPSVGTGSLGSTAINSPMVRQFGVVPAPNEILQFRIHR